VSGQTDRQTDSHTAQSGGEMIAQQSASGSDHALVELVLYVVRFAAGDLEAAQSFLDVVQQVLDVRQLAVEVRRTLELDELRHHLCVVFLPHRKAQARRPSQK